MNPCQNGGSCVSNSTGYSCLCQNNSYGINCEFTALNSTIFKNSTILTQELSIQLLIVTGLSTVNNNKTWKQCYQASRNGMSSSTFHSLCDGLLGTLTIYKTSNNFIFGGYTQADWSYSYFSSYSYDSNAFLFSLINNYNTPVRLNVTNPDMAIYSYPYSNLFPSFGSGIDLYVSDSYSYSNLGSSYNLPYGSSAHTFLAGSQSFQPIEIEVYY